MHINYDVNLPYLQHFFLKENKKTEREKKKEEEESNTIIFARHANKRVPLRY